MTRTIIGYRKFTSKKGSACCIVNLLSDFSDFDLTHGAYGQHVDEVFVPECDHNKIVPASLGKNVELLYGEGFGGQPRIVGLNILDK